jgi:hypothetical protein
MGQFQMQNILEKNKAKLKNILEEKKSEIVLLKKSLKALEDVKLSLRSDLSSLNKNLKSKDNEIFKLETQVENVKLEMALKSEVKKPKISKEIPVTDNQLVVSILSSTSSMKALPNLNNNSIKPLFIPSTPTSTTTSSTPTLSTSNSSTTSIQVTTSLTMISTETSIPDTTACPTSSTSAPNVSCSHTPQGAVRQPRRPHPDKCSVMHHAGSLYHEHIASESGVPSRYNTHEYCMRIEYKNYGCEDCIWLKWWGESTDILISILGHLENTCNHIIIVYLRTQVNGAAL